MLKVVFEENLVSDIGRACLIELGCKSRLWSRCRHICSKFGRFELVNLIWVREVSLNGIVKLGMKVNGEFWKKHICSRIIRRLANTYGKMALIIQKGRKSMYK